MRLRLGQPVETTDGPYGRLGDIIIDPWTKSVSHLVVEPHTGHQQARLVPIMLTAVRDDTVRITVDRDHVDNFERVADIDYVEIDQPVDLGPEWDVGTQRILAPVGYGDNGGPGPWYDSDHVGIAFDRIPKWECEIRSTSAVRSAEGRHLGTVEGFLTDDGHVTDVIVRAGRRGLRHYVVVPVDTVARIRTDVIDLGLDRAAFRRLPTADDVLGRADPPSGLARLEHRAGAAFHRLAGALTVDHGEKTV
jgi:sporulation protein YlmC with PRC-barrel domain